MEKPAYVKLQRFFRLRLLSLAGDWQQVNHFLSDLESEASQIKKQAMQISWHLRGGATYTDVLNFSDEEIKLSRELIQQNLEITKNTKLPYF